MILVDNPRKSFEIYLIYQTTLCFQIPQRMHCIGAIFRSFVVDHVEPSAVVLLSKGGQPNPGVKRTDGTLLG